MAPGLVLCILPLRLCKHGHPALTPIPIPPLSPDLYDSVILTPILVPIPIPILKL